MKIYTELYSPFRMGGDVHEAICTNVDALGPFFIGNGFKAFVVCDSEGRPVVAEAKSGGLIGDSIATVRKDVAIGSVKDMDTQVACAVERARNAREVDAEEFWKMRNKR